LENTTTGRAARTSSRPSAPGGKAAARPGRAEARKGTPTVFFAHDSASARLKSRARGRSSGPGGYQAHFFALLNRDLGLQALDLLNDVFFFIKDADRRFVYYNRAFGDLMNLRSRDELLALRDEDISPEYLVERYRRDDEEVLKGVGLADVVELVGNSAGGYDWFTTSKSPVFDEGGRIVGLLGVTRRLYERQEGGLASGISNLAPAVELMLRDYRRQLSVQELAGATCLSASQFSRVFKQRFGVSPHQYLRHIRLDAACELLATSAQSLSLIAENTGFYDQSHMSNAFTRAKGISPRRYRALVRAQAPAAPSADERTT